MESTWDLKRHSKYFFIMSFLLIIAISIILVWPFVTPIFGAIVFAYLFYPIYSFLFKIVKNETISAFIVSLIVLSFLILPLLFVGNTIFNEANDFFFRVRDIKFEELGEQYIDRYLGGILGENIDLSAIVKDGLNRLSINLIQSVDKFILDLPKKILSAFVMFFVMFYLFKDGKKLLFNIKEALPLKRKYKEDIATKFNETIYATMYGVVVTAIIQGIVGSIGLWIFGVKSPLLWGVVMSILAMIPFVGSSFIWFPAAVYKITINDSINGIGLLIYGLLVVSTIDNIIRPKIIGRRSKVHPVLVLIGALGGIKLFGLIGIVIGPLILSILAVFFELYLTEEYDAL